MEGLALKDALIVLGTISAILAVWYKLNNRVDNVVATSVKHDKVLFKDNGELAIVSLERCSERNAAIQRTVDKSDKRYEDLQREIREVSQNVLIIMVHLNIDPEKAKKQGVING